MQKTPKPAFELSLTGFVYVPFQSHNNVFRVSGKINKEHKNKKKQLEKWGINTPVWT